MTTKEWIETISTQVLLFVFVIGFFIITAMMIAAERWSTVDNQVGSLLTIVVMIAAYKWGSSAGSARKTEIFASEAKEDTKASVINNDIKTDTNTVNQ